MLVGGDEGQEVVPGGGAADAVGAPGGVGGQGLAQDLEHALELTREGGQVVDGQGEGPGCFAPGLLNNSIFSVCLKNINTLLFLSRQKTDVSLIVF